MPARPSWSSNFRNRQIVSDNDYDRSDKQSAIAELVSFSTAQRNVCSEAFGRVAGGSQEKGTIYETGLYFT
jgi:hypothetical protein